MILALREKNRSIPISRSILLAALSVSFSGCVPDSQLVDSLDPTPAVPEDIDDPCSVSLCTGHCVEGRCRGNDDFTVQDSNAHPVLLISKNSQLFTASDNTGANYATRWDLLEGKPHIIGEIKGRSVALAFQGEDTLLYLGESAQGWAQHGEVGLWKRSGVFGNLESENTPQSSFITLIAQPGGVAALDTTIYVTGREIGSSQPWSLFRVDEENQEVVAIPHTESADPLGKIMSVGSALLYSSPWRGDLLSIDPRAGAPPKVLVDGRAEPIFEPVEEGEHPYRGAFAVYKDQVFAWTTGGIVQGPLDGKSAPTTLYKTTERVSSIIADGSWVVWAEIEKRRLRAYRRSDGLVRTLAQDTGIPGDLVLLNHRIYWPERDTAWIRYVELP